MLPVWTGEGTLVPFASAPEGSAASHLTMDAADDLRPRRSEPGLLPLDWAGLARSLGGRRGEGVATDLPLPAGSDEPAKQADSVIWPRLVLVEREVVVLDDSSRTEARFEP